MRSLQRQELSIKAEQRSPEELLQEIRNLLTPKEKELTPRPLETDEIEEILKKSFDNYKKLQAENNKSPLKQRANEAIEIIQAHHPQSFVRDYTKKKVQSQMFFNLRGPLAVEESRSFQRQRQDLLKQLEIQKQEERRKEERVIQSRKKFIRYESRQLLYGQMNELRMKEGEASMSYLINQPAQKHQKSTNNLIEEENQQQLQGKFQQMKKDTLSLSSSAKVIKEGGDQVIEIVDNDETMNYSFTKEQLELKIQQTLKKCPNFLKTFACILKRSIAYQQYLKEDKVPRKDRESVFNNDSIITYSGAQDQFRQNKQKCCETVKQLTRDYQSQGILLRQIKERSILKQESYICEKIMSKMNGQSTDFHPRKIRLKEDEVTWWQQGQEFSFQSKRLTLIVQEIKTIQCYKQEGPFYSKVKSEVEVVHLRGKERDLKFEKNFMEGRELYNQLCMLMAKKLVHLNMILRSTVNQDLFDFVYNPEAVTFSLASGSLEDYEKFPNKDYRLMIINILTALFPFRTKVSRLDLTGVKLNVLQTSTLIKALDPLANLQTIWISETKFNPDSLSMLFQIISKQSCQKIDLKLSSCLIDDDILRRAQASLLQCNNIQKLDLSCNDITLRGFGVLIDFAAQERCSLTEFNISQCQIRNLISLGEFIKKARQLAIVYAEDCGFSFNSEEEISAFFQSCQAARLQKISLRRNELVNNLHPFETFWVSDTPKEVLLDVGTFAEKTSKNLQGRLLNL